MYSTLFRENFILKCRESPFLMILARVTPANQGRWCYQTILPKETDFIYEHFYRGHQATA